MSEQQQVGAPMDVLREEHEVIGRVLDVLEYFLRRSIDGHGLDCITMQSCVDFFRLYADQCHHAKEEALLFPALQRRGIPSEGGPIAVMLHEHRIARQLIREMETALESIAQGASGGIAGFHKSALHYLELLRNHIHKEDHCLFPMGQRALTEGDQDDLRQSFCQVACRNFSGKSTEELEALAVALEAKRDNSIAAVKE